MSAPRQNDYDAERLELFARGYQIPTSDADIIGFAELVDRILSPLPHRLKRANDVLARGRAGAVDFLDEARFRTLRELIEL